MKRRLFAAAVDLVVGAGPLLLLSPLIVVYSLKPLPVDQLAAQAILAAGALLSILSCFLIRTVQTLRSKPTIGQRMFGLKVKGASPLKVWLCRDILGWLILAVLILGLELYPLLLLQPAAMLIDLRSRSIGDIVAASELVDAGS